MLLLSPSKRVSFLMAGLLMGIALAPPLRAGEFFVSPTGSAKSAGTRNEPWDLPTALAHPRSVKPGDTLWLLGGTYPGPFQCQLEGAEGKPITLRAVPGQRVTLDTALTKDKKARLDFDVGGDWVVIWGLEFTCSEPKRKTAIAGSWPADIRRGGFYCRASHVKFINCIIHDGDNGIGFWSEGTGGEVYGCLIYNNGWRGPDRGHGHAIYTQNKTGTKFIRDNVLFNQFGEGLHAYGSSKAFLRGFHIEGNVSFNNGSATDPSNRTSEMLVGGGCPADDVVVANNFTYADQSGAGGMVRFGYGSKKNGKIVLENNYFCGCAQVRYWEHITFQENTVIAPSGLVHLFLPPKGNLKGYQWRDNTYFRTGTKWDEFTLARDDKTQTPNWPAWQQELTEPNSTFQQGKPTGTLVIVRPNAFEPGRAHVIVYNWVRKKTVSVGLSSILKKGQSFRIVSAQDYYGAAVLEGKHDGNPVALPMRDYRAVAPVGLPKHQTPVTGPEFNVFVVLSKDG